MLLVPTKLLGRILSRFGNACVYGSKTTCVSERKKRVIEWRDARGDKTLRLDYELDHDSIVFDVGGYEGQWASDIFSKYCCTIHVFEPVRDFADKIVDRFSRNKRIFVHGYGLSSESKRSRIALAQDSSSLLKQGEQSEEVILVRAVDFMQESNIQNVDLMKINIEGAEYDLLEHLIETGFITRIMNVQVQFHGFVEDAEERMHRIQKELAKTHFLTYQYRFVWENWRRRFIS